MRYLSLFSGMECAWQAWHPLGWECVAVAEIDPSACALLTARLPGVSNLGSVTDITDAQIAALGRIDVVIGGSPCQDLSVAGRRAGLAGARSSLFHEQLRIFHAARSLCDARWLVWENVPGAFSSNAGRDFGVVVGAMAGADITSPLDGWGSEGVALGDNGLVEWSVLDAQWFGVAQRRKRVFAVLDTGDWANRPPVLLERDSLRGDSPPSRETREDVAGTLAGRTSGGGGLGTDFECNGGLVRIWPADVACTLYASFGSKQGLEDQHALGGASLFVESPAIFATDGQANAAFGVDVALSLTATNEHPYVGVPECIAFSCKDHAADAGEISPTLRSMGHAESHANAGGQVAVAFQSSQSGVRVDAVHATLDACNGSRRHNGALQGMSVRRLTPRECERLQGVADDWTKAPNKSGKPMADGPRYRMIGNSFARPVITWIGRQIEAAHTYKELPCAN